MKDVRKVSSLQEMLTANRQKLGFKPEVLSMVNCEAVFNLFRDDVKDILINKNYSIMDSTSLRTPENRTAIFYSGGLESTICSASVTNGDFYYANGLNEFCHSKGILIVESFLMAITPILDANTAIIGLEYTPEENLSSYEYSNAFIEKFSNYLGISVILPVVTMDKFTLFKNATKLRLHYNSCNKLDQTGINKKPCGNCFKCFQISTFQRAIGLTNPITVNKKLVTKMILEHNEYLDTGIDKFSDNYSFTQLSNSLEEIWRVPSWTM